jgi:hypothetical protein
MAARLMRWLWPRYVRAQSRRAIREWARGRVVTLTVITALVLILTGCGNGHCWYL